MGATSGAGNSSPSEAPKFNLDVSGVCSISRFLLIIVCCFVLPFVLRGHCGHDRMVVRFTTTCAIGAYHHWLLLMARCTTLCDKVCQWLAADRWLSPGPPISSTNITTPRYNWNIVVSGVKHHKTNQPILFVLSALQYMASKCLFSVFTLFCISEIFRNEMSQLSQTMWFCRISNNWKYYLLKMNFLIILYCNLFSA
jgi:hypothetical protein